MNAPTRDTSLVTYSRPVNNPGSEKLLMYGMTAMDVTAILLFIACWAFSLISIIGSFIRATSADYLSLDAGPFIILALGGVIVGALALVAGWVRKVLYRAHRHFYSDVPQGKIVDLTIEDGMHCVVLEGYNRMNQIRRDTWYVNAKKWFDDVYVIGEYMSIPESEQE